LSAELRDLLHWGERHLHLLIPLLLAVVMAVSDLRSRRIPNYLILGAALAGLGFQFGLKGWWGLGQGFLGLNMGLILMIGFYLKGGMGAGDVKALAALGTWLGPLSTLHLFFYMGLSGIPLILVFLWWRGELGVRLRRFGQALVTVLLLRGLPRRDPAAPPPDKSQGLPYAVALALGMALLFWRHM
jgi:prepilin peptidase CpaA